jgi:hypothetical protein
MSLLYDIFLGKYKLKFNTSGEILILYMYMYIIFSRYLEFPHFLRQIEILEVIYDFSCPDENVAYWRAACLEVLFAFICLDENVAYSLVFVDGPYT